MHQITKVQVQVQSTVVRMEWKKVGVMSLVSPFLQPSRELSGLTVFTRPPISKIFVKIGYKKSKICKKNISCCPLTQKHNTYMRRAQKKLRWYKVFFSAYCIHSLRFLWEIRKVLFSSFQYFLKNKSFKGVKRGV